MIHIEAWYREALFEEERDTLYRLYFQGAISHEEFGHRMLRYWNYERNKGGLLEKDAEEKLLFTQEWIYSKGNLWQEVSVLGAQWEDAKRRDMWGSNRLPGSSVLMAETLSPQEAVVAEQYLGIFNFVPQSGERVEDYLPRGVEGCSGEESEFNAWFDKTLSDAKALVERAEEWHRERGIDQ